MNTPRSVALPGDLTLAWAEAFNAGSVSGITGLYDPQAVLWGTTATDLIDTPAGVIAYFERVLAMQPAPRVKLGAQRLRVFDDMALVSGHYELKLGGQRLPARYSMALKRSNERWLIVDHHSSLLPSG
jgi:hypothetical protein